MGWTVRVDCNSAVQQRSVMAHYILKTDPHPVSGSDCMVLWFNPWTFTYITLREKKKQKTQRKQNHQNRVVFYLTNLEIVFTF